MSAPNDLRTLDLQVYTSTWCPDCRRLDRWLEEEGIPYVRVDIESTPGAAERLERETGKRAVPFILVSGRTWCRGYHRELPGRFDGDLLRRELLEATDR